MADKKITKSFQLSIRGSMLLLVFLMPLTPMCLIVYMGMQEFRENIDNAKLDTAKFAYGVASEFRVLVRAAHELGETLSLLPDVRNHNTEMVEPILEKLIEQSPSYANIVIMDNLGNAWASGIPMRGKRFSMADRKSFKDAMATGNFSFGDYTMGKTSGKPVLSFGYPLKDSDGKLLGCIAIGFNLEYFNQTFEKVFLPSNSSFLFLDHKGIVIYRPSYPGKGIGKPYPRDLFLAMQAGPDKNTDIGMGLDGIRRIRSYTKLRLRDGESPYVYVRAAMPYDPISDKIRSRLIWKLFILVSAMLLVIVIVWHVGRRYILNPVTTFKNAIIRVANDDLGVRISGTVHVRELEQIERAFDEMVAKLAENISERRQMEQAIRESGERYRLLVETQTETVCRFAPDGTFTFVNDAYCRFVGKTKEELMGKTWQPVPVPDDLALIEEKLMTLSPSNPEVIIENRVCSGNGDIRWMQFVNKGFFDPEGNLLEIQSVGRDIHERRLAETELRESEERLSLVLEGSQLGYWDWNIVTGQVRRNARWAEMLGYTLPEVELSVKQWTDLHHPDDRAAAWKSVEDHLEGRSEMHKIEYRMRAKGGEYRWILDCAGIVRRDEQGRPLRMCGTHTDITERKQSEAALQKERDQAQMYLDIAGVMITALNAEGDIILINPKGCEILGGYAEREIIGRNWFDVCLPKEQREEVFGVFKKLVAGDIAPVEYYENPVLTKQGEQRMIAFHNTVLRDPSSRIIGILFSGEDITERKRAEDSLRESEARFRSYFEQPLIGLAITSPTKGWIEVNERLCNMLGYTNEELIKKTWAEMTHPDDLSSDMEQFNRVLSGKIEGYSLDKRFIHKNGNIIFCALSVRCVLKNDGSVNYFVALLQDITDRKRAEEELIRYRDHLEELVKGRTAELNVAKEKAEAANIAKSRFLSNMSHELRTPLNIVMGFSRLLHRDKSLMPDQQEKLSTIVKSGEHLLKLINEVLEMSKIETGSIRLSEDEFSLPQMLDLLESMYALRAREKGIGLRFETAPEIPRFVRADEQKFRQVLLNLLGNAIKFTSKGHVIARFGYSEKDARLSVEVEDTGAGIATEEMNVLFQPFGQTESGRQHTEGTGLGLSVSKKYVELMGGEIAAQSRPGKGSIFRFHIRAEKAKNGKVPEQTPARRVIGLEQGQPIYRILVAEDNADNRNLICDLLRSVGFEVCEAENGQESVELWKTASPHLILMDMRMPVMDGYEAVKIIRNSGGPASQIPIVAVTAHAFEEDRKAVMEMGCDDFIRKPFNEPELFEKIAFCLCVKYLYEEISVLEKPAPTELEPAGFADLPTELLTELRHAAMRGSSMRLLELADVIRTDNPVVADGLTTLVRAYQFKKIADLIPTSGEWK